MLTPHGDDRRYVVRRFPRWIRSALKIVDAQVPAALYTVRSDDGEDIAPIYNSVNTFQNGIGIGDPISFQSVVAINQICDFSTGAVSNTFGISPDPNVGYMLFAVSFAASVLGAPRVLPLLLAPFPLGTVLGLDIARPTIASNGVVGWTNMMRKSKPYFCPPGTVPFFYGGTLAGVETITVSVSAMRIPAGFKPY